MVGTSDDDDVLSIGTAVTIIALVVFMITFFVIVIVKWIITTLYHQCKTEKKAYKTRVANSNGQENDQFELKKVTKVQPATALTVTVIENKATKVDTN